MIFKSAFPNSPTVNMAIDGVDVDYTAINSITITSAENEHDYAELHVSGLIPRFITEYINRPIYLNIEYSPTQRTSFHGYVAFVEPKAVTRRGLINKSPIQSAVIACLGASYDMKAKKTKVWEQVTIKQVVTAIADTYNYSCQVPNNPYIFSRLVQSNESDMEFLVKTCRSLGYRVSTKGAHLHVYDPFQVISRNMPYAELTTLTDTVANTRFAPGRVLEFDGTFGSNTPYGTANSYVIETLDNAGQLIKHSATSEGMGIGLTLPSRFTDSMAVSSISLDAVKKIGNSQIRNRAPFHAHATVTGIPEVLVGSLVKLQKYNSKFDGYWMVSKVNHKVSRANYITELSLVKDSTNDSEPVLSTGVPYVLPADPILANGIWRSENSKVSTYV